MINDSTWFWVVGAGAFVGTILGRLIMDGYSKEKGKKDGLEKFGFK